MPRIKQFREHTFRNQESCRYPWTRSWTSSPWRGCRARRDRRRIPALCRTPRGRRTPWSRGSNSRSSPASRYPPRPCAWPGSRPTSSFRCAATKWGNKRAGQYLTNYAQFRRYNLTRRAQKTTVNFPFPKRLWNTKPFLLHDAVFWISMNDRVKIPVQVT